VMMCHIRSTIYWSPYQLYTAQDWCSVGMTTLKMAIRSNAHKGWSGKEVSSNPRPWIGRPLLRQGIPASWPIEWQVQDSRCITDDALSITYMLWGSWRRSLMHANAKQDTIIQRSQRAVKHYMWGICLRVVLRDRLGQCLVGLKRE
jgi:hypothetical protein